MGGSTRQCNLNLENSSAWLGQDAAGKRSKRGFGATPSMSEETQRSVSGRDPRPHMRRASSSCSIWLAEVVTVRIDNVKAPASPACSARGMSEGRCTRNCQRQSDIEIKGQEVKHPTNRVWLNSSHLSSPASGYKESPFPMKNSITVATVISGLLPSTCKREIL
jgi:hypothetical protein